MLILTVVKAVLMGAIVFEGFLLFETLWQLVHPKVGLKPTYRTVVKLPVRIKYETEVILDKML